MRQFFILSALCVGMAALTPAHAGEKVWISLGDAALAQLQKHRPAARAVASVQADARACTWSRSTRTCSPR